MKRSIRISGLIFLVLIIFLFHSCKKEKVPILTTSPITNITGTSATCGGTITAEGAGTVIARGVCWSTSTSPTINDSKTTDGAGAGSFTSIITGLNGETSYYLRAYATNTAGTGYGMAMSFTTLLLDIDGNVYHTVTIGTQTWMKENLKTTKYRNGDPIAKVTDSIRWLNLTSSAYCDYKNDIANSETFGRLYNWYAINENSNIAPIGWHVATDAEWTILANFLGGSSLAAGKLKEAGLVHWNSPNTAATNESGFSALPAGVRNQNAHFDYMKDIGAWWSSTEGSTNTAFEYDISASSAQLYRNDTGKKLGASIRCVKDN